MLSLITTFQSGLPKNHRFAHVIIIVCVKSMLGIFCLFEYDRGVDRHFLICVKRIQGIPVVC